MSANNANDGLLEAHTSIPHQPQFFTDNLEN